MTDFATLSLSALVRSYNTVAVALGETEVRKFADKPGAVKRLHNIIVRALEAEFRVEYHMDGSVQEVVKVQSVHSTDGVMVDEQGDEDNFAPTDGVGGVPSDESNFVEPKDDETLQNVQTDGATTTAEPAPATKLSTTLDLTAKVKILVANPKRAGSRAHAVFSLYRDGQTGQEFVDAVVAAGHTVRVALTNLHWDLDHGFIYLGE